MTKIQSTLKLIKTKISEFSKIKKRKIKKIIFFGIVILLSGFPTECSFGHPDSLGFPLEFTQFSFASFSWIPFIFDIALISIFSVFIYWIFNKITIKKNLALGLKVTGIYILIANFCAFLDVIYLYLFNNIEAGSDKIENLSPIVKAPQIIQKSLEFISFIFLRGDYYLTIFWRNWIGSFIRIVKPINYFIFTNTPIRFTIGDYQSNFHRWSFFLTLLSIFILTSLIGFILIKIKNCKNR